jgi:hypothetical protein
MTEHEADKRVGSDLVLMRELASGSSMQDAAGRAGMSERTARRRKSSGNYSGPMTAWSTIWDDDARNVGNSDRRSWR